jgi:hypothetical protein
MTLYNPIPESQFLVNFSGYGNFYFSEKSGGDIERDSSEYANGSGNQIYQVVGPQKISNVTLKAPYDLKLMSYLEPVIFRYSCGVGETITITPVSCQGEIITDTTQTANSPNPFSISGVTPIAIGEPYIYSGARLKKYSPPKVDRKSAAVAMFEIEFIVNTVSRGRSVPQSAVTAGSTKAYSEFFGTSL